jgi:hypothetical protein
LLFDEEITNPLIAVFFSVCSILILCFLTSKSSPHFISFFVHHYWYAFFFWFHSLFVLFWFFSCLILFASLSVWFWFLRNIIKNSSTVPSDNLQSFQIWISLHQHTSHFDSGCTQIGNSSAIYVR